MSSIETINVLHRVLAILCRSFPQYLVAYARPYVPPGNERIAETLKEIAADQQSLADRIIQMIYDADSVPDTGEFPMEYTDSNDLLISYLVGEAVKSLQRDLQQLTDCAASLHLAPAAKSLVEEAVGMTKGHLESLRELVGHKASA